MRKELFLPVLLGTNRNGRNSENVARWVLKKIEERDDIETQFFDARDFKLLEDDYGQTIKDLFPEYRDAITRADGLVIVAPEYNHSFPGQLKSILDLLLKEYTHKAVGLVGVSAGPWGGTRVIESLVPVVRELGLVVTHADLNFSIVQNTFNEDGTMKEEFVGPFDERVNKFLEELVWIARALRYGRENS
ncbi:NADPH-dependent FMN reductase [bacterium]|nr:NADPH-dependent FMN reductase [bacterium]|tara:strand:- start:378 stop:947 length:570 start_codon:yes stop_codon:yes gene_type:complete